MADPLAIYLHDHLAGSHFALHLLNSIREQYRDEPLGSFAVQLAEEITQDQQALEQIIEVVGRVHLDLVEVTGWLSEKAAQLKLGRDHHSNGLGTFEALEMLTLGIQGKRSLWKILPVIRETDCRVPDLDYRALQARAETQYNQTEQQRFRLAETAFMPGNKGHTQQSSPVIWRDA